MLTIQDLKEQNLILLESTSGSRAYGLDTPESDWDIKGVFYLPKDQFYGLDYVPQINNNTNDIVYYELGRFIELLAKNNPNILELLNTPEHAVIHKSPLLEKLDSSKILSKKCQDTFGKFALSQIKKSKGLNKKVMNPISKERKTILDFCFVKVENGSVSLRAFLEENDLKQPFCGLAKIPNMQNVYALYYSEKEHYKGIIQNDQSTDVSLSSIPKEEKSLAVLYCNKDGYSTYCKKYREYWNWVDERNEVRYSQNIKNGKNYDSKNMMHTFRLLEMAIEIANEKKVNVKRPNREFLLDIKFGKFEYDELLEKAMNKKSEMEKTYASSDLPDQPDLEYLENFLIETRTKLYS